MSAQLVGLLCVYNERDLLPGAIASLRGVADRVVLADGRFARYPGTSGPSTDGTLDVAADCCAEAALGLDVIESPRQGWETEHAKRSALVAHRSLELGDEMLILDGDERLRTKGNIRRLHGDYRLRITGEDGTPTRSSGVRLVAWRPGLVYHWHFGLFTEGGQNVLISYRWTHLAHVAHVASKRSAQRQADDKVWEDWLVPYEHELGAYDLGGGRSRL